MSFRSGRYSNNSTQSSALLSSPASSSYGDRPDSHRSGLAEKYSLAPDPTLWGSNLSMNHPEPDDALHNPEVRNGKYVEHSSFSWSKRAFYNVGCLVILCLAILTLFVGYPVMTYMQNTLLAINNRNILVNSTGQVAAMGNYGLIDLDTPQDAYTLRSLVTGKDMKLVFSDEFNTDGRTFYPGDDPYWEAVDLHYWATNNMEWYDPSAVTTANGSLVITLSRKPSHGLNYEGGLLSSWNKFCFTGGYLVTAATLPGANNIHGLWPAFWAMGNLGRAGYGATLDGIYTYDACDVGTAPNQTLNGLPALSLTSGDPKPPTLGAISFLPGQRLSRCTCRGESHPGPVHKDGTYVGRSAPEIDVFEAQIDREEGAVSQSGQWAPFNIKYQWQNTSDNLMIVDPTVSVLNTYLGGAYQQASSVVSKTNQACYELHTGCLAIYGFEYQPGFGDAYISWVNDGKLAWTVKAAGLGPDTRAEISARPVPQEPLYILANLGMSENFGTVDLEHLTFPTIMKMDYVRVYQYPDSINVGCDPPDFPTSAYINTYIGAYTNPNLTTWVDDYKQTIPKNSFLGQC